MSVNLEGILDWGYALYILPKQARVLSIQLMRSLETHFSTYDQTKNRYYDIFLLVSVYYTEKIINSTKNMIKVRIKELYS